MDAKDNPGFVFISGNLQGIIKDVNGQREV